MCNRTDCAGSWAGAMACAVCREMDMELNERQKKILQRVRSGRITLTSSKVNDADYRELAKNELIDCHNFGHFQPTIFLTDKGRNALQESAQ